MTNLNIIEKNKSTDVAPRRFEVTLSGQNGERIYCICSAFLSLDATNLNTSVV